MCELKSMIVLKNKVFCPLDYDSHTEMLEELKITDTKENASKKFVRVEVIPTDGLFNHDLSKWETKVDQDIKPDWYDDIIYEELCKKELQKWFDKRFIINQEYKQIKDGRFFVNNSSVKAYDNSSVKAYDNSSVKAYNNSSVEAYVNSSIEAYNNSSVKAYGNSSVEAYVNSSVEAYGNSSVLKGEYSNAIIKEIQNNATVKDITGDKPIIYVANLDNFEFKKF